MFPISLIVNFRNWNGAIRSEKRDEVRVNTNHVQLAKMQWKQSWPSHLQHESNQHMPFIQQHYENHKNIIFIDIFRSLHLLPRWIYIFCQFFCFVFVFFFFGSASGPLCSVWNALFNDDHLRSHMECAQRALPFGMRKQTDYWLSTIKQRYKYSRLYTDISSFIATRFNFYQCDYSANNMEIFVNCAHFLQQHHTHIIIIDSEKTLARICKKFRWNSCVSYYIND